MKKLIVILFIFVVLICFKERNNILIPEDSIRLRVIANSDNKIDQDIKLEIKDKVENVLYRYLKKAHNTKDARKIINDNIDKIDELLSGYNIEYDINYGNNYFPEKEYKGITYDEGNYESLVITLGSGVGSNWWCVLFPPLCLLDEGMEDVEYDYYVAKLINNYKE